jgi:hypothetical protein
VLEPRVQEAVDLVANALAETLLANMEPQLWPAVMKRLTELINPS